MYINFDIQHIIRNIFHIAYNIYINDINIQNSTVYTCTAQIISAILQ